MPSTYEILKKVKKKKNETHPSRIFKILLFFSRSLLIKLSLGGNVIVTIIINSNKTGKGNSEMNGGRGSEGASG